MKVNYTFKYDRYVFSVIFIDGLFKPGAKVNPEHKSKYMFLLAYSSVVVEVWKKVRLLRIRERIFQLLTMNSGNSYFKQFIIDAKHFQYERSTSNF